MKGLLTLLHRALWGADIDGAEVEDNLSEILFTADNQTVTGLCVEALSNINIKASQDFVFYYVGLQQSIKAQNAAVNKELLNFVDFCDENKLTYLVVKGQTIGVLYPDPNLRMPGDIDFLIPHSGRSKWAKSVGKFFLGAKIPDKMAVDEVSFDRNGQPFELHTNLRTFVSKKHREEWDEHMAKEWSEPYYIEIDGRQIHTLSPTMNAAYVFIHLFFHFIREGVSLRQFCDWAMILSHYKEEIDKDSLIQLLLGLDLFDAYCAFGVILVEDLGMPKKFFPFVINDDDKKWRNKLLTDIFRGGNFGKLNHQANKAWLYKIETSFIAVRNSFRYYSLCPSEVGGMIPRLIKKNINKVFWRQ